MCGGMVDAINSKFIGKNFKGSSPFTYRAMAEWLIASVLKTESSDTWVQILLRPKVLDYFNRYFFFIAYILYKNCRKVYRVYLNILILPFISFLLSGLFGFYSGREVSTRLSTFCIFLVFLHTCVCFFEV